MRVQRLSIAEILGRMAPIDRRRSTGTRRPGALEFVCVCVHRHVAVSAERVLQCSRVFPPGCACVMSIPCVCMWARARRTVRSTRLRPSRPRWRLGGNTRESGLSGGGGGGRAPYADSTPPPTPRPIRSTANWPGGRSVLLYSASSSVGYPPNSPTPAEDRWWLLVCGVGCLLRGWSVVGLECDTTAVRGEGDVPVEAEHRTSRGGPRVRRRILVVCIGNIIIIICDVYTRATTDKRVTFISPFVYYYYYYEHILQYLDLI